jgi:hypothetical protein
VKITFRRFNIGDVEDPDIAVAPLILEWQETAHGIWVMKHAHDLTYHTQPDAQSWGIDVAIRGELRDPRLVTEYFLRWPHD